MFKCPLQHPGHPTQQQYTFIPPETLTVETASYFMLVTLISWAKKTLNNEA